MKHQSSQPGKIMVRIPRLMRLLFIKLKHIGDSLLLTPTLSAVRTTYPDAHLTVIVRRGCEGILGGCPAVDRIATTAAAEAGRRSRVNWIEDFQLIRELRRERFDIVFELSDGDRGRWFATGVRTGQRCTNAVQRPLNWWWRRKFNRISEFTWKNRHRVEKDFFTVQRALPIAAPIPRLTFESDRTVPWLLPESFTDFAVIHPATRWKRKQWPTDHWVALGRSLLTETSNLIISVGPDPEEVQLGRTLAAAIGSACVSTLGTASWAQLAWLLHRSRLFVGVDTAAMHLAAACQCPTVALFGPSVVEQWRPWQVPHKIVQPTRLSGESTQTADIPAQDVMDACQQMLSQNRV